MKNILFLFSLILFCGCDDLNKSIFEPLALKELDEAIKKDSLFSIFYEQVQAINENTLDTDSKKAKYADLTYRRAYDLFFYQDTVLYRDLSKEWKSKYANYSTKADSIINYWKQLKKENSLDQYVKIEVANITTKYYSFGGVDDVNIGFRLTPLKETIEQLRFSYLIEPKINQDESKSIYSSILDKSWCLSTSPFSKPVVKYWEVGYSNEKKLAGETAETLLRDYNVKIEIDKVRIGGRNYSTDDIKLPHCVEMYLEYGGSYYIDDIIQEYIDNNYIPLYKYITDGINNRLKEKDALAFEYLNLPTEKKKEDVE